MFGMTQLKLSWQEKDKLNELPKPPQEVVDAFGEMIQNVVHIEQVMDWSQKDERLITRFYKGTMPRRELPKLIDILWGVGVWYAEDSRFKPNSYGLVERWLNEQG